MTGSTANAATVTLSSANTAIASVPASVVVAVGSATAKFNVTTTSVPYDTPVVLTATYSGKSINTTLIVQGVNGPSLSAFTLSPSTIIGAGTSNGTVTLATPAPATGSVVTLTSPNPTLVSVPATVTIAAGATTATFPISVTNPTASTSVILSANLSGITKTATIAVQVPKLTGLTLDPTTVGGGATVTGTFTLDGVAPKGGFSIGLTSSNPTVASVSASVTVPEGSSATSFPITTAVVVQDSTATITAIFNGQSQTALLTVKPLKLTGLTLNPTNIKEGATSAGTVTLNFPSPPGGTLVTLTSSNPPVASSPTSVTIPAGSTTATFVITTAIISQNTDVTFTANYNGIDQTAVLTVQLPVLSSLALNPTNIRGGFSSTGIVTIDAPAPAGGVKVTLTSPNPAQASVPASVTVPAGATTVVFPISTTKVTTTVSMVLTAAYNSITKTALFVLMPVLPFDFDGDGHNDLVFQDKQTGQMFTWFMNGANVLGGSSFSALPSLEWGAVGVADFNNDGHPDVMFQNVTNGKLAVWNLNGTVLQDGYTLPMAPDIAYKVVATGDFNGDGNIDLVFQHQTTHVIAIWYMKNSQVIGSTFLSHVPPSGLKVVGAGDFDGDGQTDLLLQNTATGQLTVWFLRAGAYVSAATIATNPTSTWHVQGVADYNGDGKPDIIFQSSLDNRILIWFMNGLTVNNPTLTTVAPLSTYYLVGPH